MKCAEKSVPLHTERKFEQFLLRNTLNMENSFNACIEDSIKKYWNFDALTDYKGVTLQYQDVARKIEKLHILFEESGIQKGDKIALCGRNMSNWAVAFLATLTYGAVAVPILHEFTADQIHNIVNHSEAKLLFVGDVVSTQIDPDKMPDLHGIVNIPDYSLMVSRTDKLTYARENLNLLFGQKFPKFFRKEMVNYYKEQNPDELALINYTSCTTGFSKGVMIPYRAMWSNLLFANGSLQTRLLTSAFTLATTPSASCQWLTCTAWHLSSSRSLHLVVTFSSSHAFLLQPLSLRHLPKSSLSSSSLCLWSSRRSSGRKCCQSLTHQP